MSMKTIQELKDEGYTVYSESEAREVIAEDIFEGLKKQASEPVINKYIDLSELQRLVRRDR